MSSYSYKNNIFEDFIQNLKKTLKIPKELFAYPPFFDITDDIDSLIYYSFEIPSYLKLFDFINAICYVFDKKYYSTYPQDINFEKIINKYFFTSLQQSHQQSQSQTQTQTQLKISLNNKNYKKQEIVSSDSIIDTQIDTQISEKPRIKNNKMLSSKTSKISSSDSNSNSNSETQADTSDNDNDDLKSRLNHDQISTLSSKDKKLIHNTNTYIELNIENSINYGLDTDK
jgi:hypothetical protein